MRLFAIVAAAALLAAAAATAGAGGGAEEMYYGRTSQGRAVAIDIRGDRTAGAPGKYLYLHRYYLMLRGDTQRPLPTGIRVVRNAVHVHTKVVGRANITAEIWFDARRSGDRRMFTGTYRDVVTLQDGHTMSTGAIRFTAKLWASSAGAAWSGTRSDGKPITAELAVLPSPEDLPKYTITVPELTLPLSCTRSEGATESDVTAKGLSAALVPARHWPPPAHGEYMFEHGLYTLGATATATTTTGDGITAKIALGISRLRWSGSGLLATGTATVTGAGAGVTCQRNSVNFTLRPR